MGSKMYLPHLLLLVLTTQAAPSGKENPEDDVTILPNLIPKKREADVTINPDLILNRKVNTCECAKPVSSGRIVGGKEVSPKYKLPYQVMFQAHNYMCGGTIINKRYVITAAHCLFAGTTQMKPETHNLAVILGEHNICDGVNEGGKGIKVEKVIIRSDYGKGANDFAILRLAKEIQFTKNIKPACLPETNTKDYSGLMATVSGWGGTIGYGPNEQQPQQPRQCGLKETSIKIFSPKDCAAVTRGDSKTRICGFASGTDSCQGDSGGPLTVVEGGKFVLVGVVSYGFGCASKYPGVYARVQNYLDWVKQITKDGDCSSGSSNGSTEATVAPATTTTKAPPKTTTSNDYYYNYYSYFTY